MLDNRRPTGEAWLASEHGLCEADREGGMGTKEIKPVFVLPCRDVSGIVDLFQQRVDLESIFNFKTKSVFDNFYSVIALGAIAGNFQAEGLPKQLSLSGVNYKGSENTKQKNFKIS